MIRPRVDFDTTIPKELLEAIQIALEPSLHLAPRWCSNLYVTYSDQPHEGSAGSSAATMDVRYAYRTGTLTIYPCWFSSTPEYRRNVLRHEILHLVVGIIYHWAYVEMEALTKDNADLQRVLLAEGAARCEAVVEDLIEILAAERGKD